MIPIEVAIIADALEHLFPGSTIDDAYKVYHYLREQNVRVEYERPASTDFEFVPGLF